MTINDIVDNVELEEIQLNKKTVEKDRVVSNVSVPTDFAIQGITESDTKRNRLYSIYNNIAKSKGFSSIEEFYASKKMELLMLGSGEGGLTKDDNTLVTLLRSVAVDLGYTGANKEFIIEDKIPILSDKQAIMR